MNIIQTGANASDARLGPESVIVDLTGKDGLTLRERALAEAEAVKSKGGEAGNVHQQATGKLAEIVLRLLLPDAKDGSDLGHDFILASGLKIDSKCRGGEKPFAREYLVPGQRRGREAKHNFFAGQVYGGDPTRSGRKATADAYVLSHLFMPSTREFPGTVRQKNWALFLCGWASAARVANAVYLARGSLTEQGRTWFTYRGEEVEFYHRNLSPLWLKDNVLQPLATLQPGDVTQDAARTGDRHLTNVDFDRIVADLIGHGIVKGPPPQLDLAEPILNPNQYWHAAELLDAAGAKVDRTALEKYVGPPLKFAPRVKAAAPPPDDAPSAE